MTRFACLALALAPLALGADDKKPDPKGDRAALNGKWKVTALTFDGKEQKVPGERTMVIDADGLTAYTGDKKGRTLTFALDATANPKHIDLTLSATDQKAAGLYVLAGDKLTICYGEPGAARPKKLESKGGDKTFLLVLERAK
ncbi:MAG: TIGR03067 domain-containing protein [Planctomycetes bacterium]|nr:TIGR03067 domain-containing protein [Planctomycetota bacterium]